MWYVFKMNTSNSQDFDSFRCNISDYMTSYPAYSLPTKISVLLASSFTCLVGVPGNILIIWTHLYFKHLWIPHNAFVVSLAISDTIIILYLLPINMAVVVTDSNIIKGYFCKINAIVAHVAFTSSLQSIMFVAVCRLAKICFTSSTFHKIFKRRNIAMMLVITWIMGPVFLLPLKFICNSIIFDPWMRMCMFNRYASRWYTYSYSGLCLGVPMVVTCTCYCLIYRRFVQSKGKMVRHWNNGLSMRKILHEIRVTKSHLAVFMAYLIFYFPFGVIVFVPDPHKIPSAVHALATYLCFANSSINCVLYGLLNRNVRSAYNEAICCLRSNRKQSVNVKEADDSNKICTTEISHIVKTSTDV